MLSINHITKLIKNMSFEYIKCVMYCDVVITNDHLHNNIITRTEWRRPVGSNSKWTDVWRDRDTGMVHIFGGRKLRNSSLKTWQCVVGLQYD